jgi:hypothetical protein
LTGLSERLRPACRPGLVGSRDEPSSGSAAKAVFVATAHHLCRVEGACTSERGGFAVDAVRDAADGGEMWARGVRATSGR